MATTTRAPWALKAGLRALVLAVLFALLAAASAGAGQLAAGQPPDPARNIPIDYASAPDTCHTSPQGSTCETFAVAQLDVARTREGLPAYRLPRNFLRLPPGSQLLVLTNLDRIAYGIAPVAGVNVSLNGAAGAAAASGRDPEPPAGFFDRLREAGWASNWAGGMPNILLAYDAWMYDDGYNAGNLDCQAPASSGCWGHRHDVFAFAGLPTAMGVAVGRYQGQPSYTQLIIATFPQAVTATHIPFTVTWPALAAG
jgi:hypothetical protein